jgi:hypothetical protein
MIIRDIKTAACRTTAHDDDENPEIYLFIKKSCEIIQ